MKTKVVAGILSATFALSGCANLTDPARITSLSNKHTYWMNYDASRRGAVVISDGSNTKTCSEPAPDVALSLSSTLKAVYTGADATSVTADGTAASTVMALAGRDSAVLLAREALFRLCEASLNTTMSGAEMQATITAIFDKVATIATEETKKSVAEAQIAGAQVQIWQQKAAIAAAAAKAADK
jgi:hypothetical protein